MKRAHFSEEQIIGILKAAQAAGSFREVVRQPAIAADKLKTMVTLYGRV